MPDDHAHDTSGDDGGCSGAGRLRDLGAAVAESLSAAPGYGPDVTGLVLLDDEDHAGTTLLGYAKDDEELTAKVISQMIQHLRSVMRRAGMRLSVYDSDGTSPFPPEEPDERHEVKIVFEPAGELPLPAKRILDAVTAATHGPDGCGTFRMILISDYRDEPSASVMYHGFTPEEPGEIISMMLTASKMMAKTAGADIVFMDGRQMLGGSPN